MLREKNEAFIQGKRATDIVRFINAKRLQLRQSSEAAEGDDSPMSSEELQNRLSAAEYKFNQLKVSYQESPVPVDPTSLLAILKGFDETLHCTRVVKHMPIEGFFVSGSADLVKEILRTHHHLLVNNQFNSLLSSIALAITCAPLPYLTSFFEPEFQLFWLLNIFLDSNSLSVAHNGILSLGNLAIDAKDQVAATLTSRHMWRNIRGAFERYRADPELEKDALWFFAQVVPSVSLQSKEALALIFSATSLALKDTNQSKRHIVVQALSILRAYLENDKRFAGRDSSSAKVEALASYHFDQYLTFWFSCQNEDVVEEILHIYLGVTRGSSDHVRIYFLEPTVDRITQLALKGRIKVRVVGLQILKNLGITDSLLMAHILSEKVLIQLFSDLFLLTSPDILVRILDLIESVARKQKQDLILTMIGVYGLLEALERLVVNDSDMVKLAALSAFEALLEVGLNMEQSGKENLVMASTAHKGLNWKLFVDPTSKESRAVEDIKRRIREEYCPDYQLSEN